MIRTSSSRRGRRRSSPRSDRGAAAPASKTPARPPGLGHGEVVDSVNVSALEYVPVRNGSFSLMSCENSIVSSSFETGPLHVSRFSGEADEPTLLYAVPLLAALRARACSGCGRMNDPFTRWPVPNEDGSDTLNSASPAVEVTTPVVEAKYVCRTPGVNAPNCAGAPSDSESVGGT